MSVSMTVVCDGCGTRALLTVARNADGSMDVSLPAGWIYRDEPPVPAGDFSSIRCYADHIVKHTQPNVRR